MHVIAISNQKGGVGKSTTTSSLGAALALVEKKRVLVIDLDPQGTLTKGTLGKEQCEQVGTAEALGFGSDSDESCRPIADLTAPVPVFGFDLLSSNGDNLRNREESLRSDSTRQFALSRQLAEVEEAYDYVLIDSPPNLGALTISSLYAADWLLVPIQAAGEAVDGVGQIKRTFERVQLINKSAKMLGAVMTFFNSQANVAQATLAQIESDPVFPFTARVRTAEEFRKCFLYKTPIMVLAPKHKATGDILALARQVVKDTENGGSHE